LSLFLPAALLVAAALPRFQSGRAIDAAYPVPAYTVMNIGLPASAYRAAADVLAGVNAEDGRTSIERAEIASLAGAPHNEVMSLLEDGLARTPASVRGWALFAEQTVEADRARAGKALAHSLLLGPYEYYVMAKRARAAAQLWDVLPSDGSSAALDQARRLWTESALNHEIPALLIVKGGPELITRAFHDDPEDLRALNRWLAAERRRAAADR
jgi:hypothetical protein